MEETITLPNEINRLCRTCMTVAQDSEQFFKNALIDGTNLTDLGEMLQDLTSVEMSSCDGLPGVLCDQCVDKLESAYSFKKQCEDVRSNLKELLMLFDDSTNTTDSEKEDKESQSLESFEDQTSLLLDNFNENRCKICKTKFESFYHLSKHVIDHNKEKTLLQRYNENLDSNSKEVSEIKISEEVIALIKCRKSKCSVSSKTNATTENISDAELEFLEGITKDKVDSDENVINTLDIPPKTIIKKISFPSSSNIAKSTKLYGSNQEIVTNVSFNRRLSTPTTCKHCGKRFSSKNKCKLHYCPEKDKRIKEESIEDSLTENPITCDLCNKVFPNSLMVSIHFIYHILLEESSKNSDLLQEWLFCNICGQVFQNEQEIAQHKDMKHEYQSLTFLCEKCGISFEKDTDLILHEDQDHADTDLKNIYFCPICNESFESKSQLLDHGLHHLMKKIYCRVCRLEFCTQASLNDHMKVHPRYKHICNICGKCLSSNSALKSHMMGIHNQDALYMCTTCGKCFKTSNRLRIHREIHSANKKFMCSYCGYRSHKSGDLKLHLRTHTSEHPYKCTFANCNRMFKTSSHFNQHIRHHLDIKQYQCQYCMRRFSHSYTLKLHKMRHTGEKPHSCIACPAKFRRKDHLRIHMKQHQK